MKKQEIKIHNYAVILEPAAKGIYSVTIPALPDVIIQCKTIKEARTLAADAIERNIAELKCREPLPDKDHVEEGIAISYITSYK